MKLKPGLGASYAIRPARKWSGSILQLPDPHGAQSINKKQLIYLIQFWQESYVYTSEMLLRHFRRLVHLFQGTSGLKHQTDVTQRLKFKLYITLKHE